jgi:hypothetical protein
VGVCVTSNRSGGLWLTEVQAAEQTRSQTCGIRLPDAVTNRHPIDRLYEQIAARFWRAPIPPSCTFPKFPSSFWLYSKNRKELDMVLSLSVLVCPYFRITFIYRAGLQHGNEPSGPIKGGEFLTR